MNHTWSEEKPNPKTSCLEFRPNPALFFGIFYKAAKQLWVSSKSIFFIMEVVNKRVTLITLVKGHSAHKTAKIQLNIAFILGRFKNWKFQLILSSDLPFVDAFALDCPSSKGNHAPHPKFERPDEKNTKSKIFLKSVQNLCPFLTWKLYEANSSKIWIESKQMKINDVFDCFTCNA